MTDHRSPKVQRAPPKVRPQPRLVGGIPRCSHGAPIWACVAEGPLDREHLELHPDEPEPRLPIHPPTVPRCNRGCNLGCIAALAGCAAFWVVVLLVAATVVW